MTIDDRALREVALSRSEYEEIVRRLGRTPNRLELGMFGAMWSEHCGYKNSKPLLRLFHQPDERLLVQPGEENAGAVRIGDGLAVVMKIESHNHPSAIEPFQGAATGVGGIVRDIFTMGARPVAILDSLRFGPLSEPRNRYLFENVVAGIGWYGNCLGIANVGGETFFAGPYSGNPLVNAMCVGILPADRLVRARATGVGNLLLLVGADTGRDGIHGATFASVELSEESAERRPAVQVGNPFLEKLLMEACLTLAEGDAIVGLQDLGAAGLTSAVVECAARGAGGAEIDVQKVPRRERGMNPYEVMLSESQERMLVIVRPERLAEVQVLFERWDLHSDVIGRVTGDGLVRVKDGEALVAELPVAALTDPPLYTRPVEPPAWLAELQQFDPATLPDLTAPEAAPALLRLLAAPNIAAKDYIFRQYDQQVGTDTVVTPGADAAVLRIKGVARGIALSTDGNGRLCYLDPRAGGAIAVAEAARNVVCMGAEPVAATDCLNFGNPEKLEIYYQLHEAITGMAEACRVLNTPVISGNVSLYNESETSAVYPTPVVGMVGVLEDVCAHVTLGFKQAGDHVLLAGGGAVDGLAGSEYLEIFHGRVAGRPVIDLELEQRVQAFTLAAIRRRLVRSAHDCALGGLAVALARCCIAGDLGLDAAAYRPAGRLDAVLFGEGQSRIVLSCAPEALAELERLAQAHGVPLQHLGTAGGDRFRLGATIDLPLAAIAEAWREGLPRALTG